MTAPIPSASWQGEPMTTAAARNLLLPTHPPIRKASA
ncbi:hypothetical protein SAMN04489730_7952 [Amycolatopsis australiensis]|uniref:Uncharacterized protein n=1 Tax=Amycolatopsis australiensis TaxID=546364 RepID=A0A1K1T433_9PSEU|nr:hypothetical protein SAMN04489730_7952 [Amycolatopsis australiensis]